LLIGSSDPEAFLRSGANDATRAANKQYALQKSCYCPIYTSKKQNRLPHFLERSVVAKQPEFCIQVLTDNESLSFWSCSAKIHDQHEASTHFNPNYLCFTSLSHLWEAGFER